MVISEIPLKFIVVLGVLRDNAAIEIIKPKEKYP